MASRLEEKMARFRKRNEKKNNKNDGSRIKGIFHSWKDGDNVLRFIGEFLEVRTHFIAPNSKMKAKGFCPMDRFQGENKLPQVVNCANWDLETDTEIDGGCVICKLNKISRDILYGGNHEIDDDDKAFLDDLRRNSNARVGLKWNVIERSDPYVSKVDDKGNEEQVLGLKIASVGMEAFKDIDGIFEQLQFDLTDPEKGIDISVNKGHNGTRPVYSANAVLSGLAIKQTPLTEEELELDKHDLLAICGRQTDQSAIFESLRSDLKEMIEDVESEDEDEEDESFGEMQPEEAEDEVVIDEEEEEVKPKSKRKEKVVDEDEDDEWDDDEEEEEVKSKSKRKEEVVDEDEDDEWDDDEEEEEVKPVRKARPKKK
jgi:hypothetical protein